MSAIATILSKPVESAAVPAPDGLDAAQALMVDSLRTTSLAPIIEELSGVIAGGKMLRARLSLKVGAATGAPRDALLRAAAAVEMIHAASLLHDDVIDGGMLRRGSPSFWARKGVSGAILLGDLLVCKAMQLLDGKAHGRLSVLLVRLTGEMCDAETEQELVTHRNAGADRGANWEKSVSLARRKTGSLFAFAAAASDRSGGKRANALLEAGYRIGTAYQLADDILDACGIPVGDGKDLGQDVSKFTSASAGMGISARRCIATLRADASKLLASWPSVQEAWDDYVRDDLGPVVERFVGG
ncbi:MAG: polyprenyl synthetase family protein [Lentisphaerae bacterium]|nr:polyprenyl synthetase family protein [Lentisphaerota bacterium]